MYAVHARHEVDPATKKYPVLIETKHLVQKFVASVSASLENEEDSFGNQHGSVYTQADFVVTALCGVEFVAPEITMFGDADLCEKCSKICKNLPRYIR